MRPATAALGGRPDKAGMYLNNIQALRFASAFIVLMLHVGASFIQSHGVFFAPIFDTFKIYGNMGVDIFFVISGYIMFASTARHHAPGDVPAFLARRFTRIYLGYWPWLAVFSYLVFHIAHTPVAQFALPRSILLLNVPGEMILPVAWSLPYEIQFYTAFALAMLAGRRMSVALMVLWGIAGGIAGQLWPDFPQWLASTYVCEFSAGVALAAGISRFGAPNPAWLILAAVLQLLYTTYFFGSFSLTERTLMFGGFATLVVAAVVALELRGMTAGKRLVLLGDASYTLYLCHVPLIFLCQYWLGQQAATRPSLIYGGLVCVIVAFSVVWYTLVERPVYKASSRMAQKWLEKLL